MKNYTTTFYSTIIAFCLIMSSCSKEQTLDINDSELQNLTEFIDDANAKAEVFSDFEGPSGSEIFGNNRAAVCGHDPEDVIGPCLWAIDDLLVELGFNSIEKVEKWMEKPGDLLNNIKDRNNEFGSQHEIVLEIACRIAPEILTRSVENDCYKNNVVSILNSAINISKSTTTNFGISESDLASHENAMYEVGSPTYKLWRFLVDSKNCN